MKSRCYVENDTSYYNYGKLGVVVCDSWRGSFENFYNDMGPCPSNNYSIDRFPNKNGNYEPGNCRWATDKEQCNNRKNNKYLEYNGEKLTYSQWEDKLGFRKGTIKCRINIRKWSVEKTLTTPLIPKNRINILFDGKTISALECSKRINIPYHILKQKIASGMSIEEIIKEKENNDSN